MLDDGRYGNNKIAHDPSTYTYALDLNLGRRNAARSALSLEDGLARLPHLWRYTLLSCSLELIETFR